MTIQINSFADLTMEEFRAREISRKPIDAVIRVKF
jgi:hypothetical protein